MKNRDSIYERHANEISRLERSKYWLKQFHEGKNIFNMGEAILFTNFYSLSEGHYFASTRTYLQIVPSAAIWPS